MSRSTRPNAYYWPPHPLPPRNAAIAFSAPFCPIPDPDANLHALDFHELIIAVQLEAAVGWSHFNSKLYTAPSSPPRRNDG